MSAIPPPMTISSKNILEHMCTCKHFLQGAFQTGNCWVIRDERCHTELTLHVPFREVMPMPLPPPTNQRTSLIMCAQLLQSCPTLCDPMHGSPPRSSVHGILQARILEWVAMPSSRGSSQPNYYIYILLCYIISHCIYTILY